MNRNNWRWFRVGDLFTPQKCKCSNATELLEDGDEIAYIGAKKSCNGVMRYVKRVEKLVSRGNCIVFIGDGQGSVGYCLYQPVDFIGSTTLIAGYSEHLNPYNAAFIVSVLDQERFRYSFGRKYKKEVIANTKIQLPAINFENGDFAPDWKYMEDFVKDQIIPQLPKKAQKVWLQKYDTKPMQQEKMKLNTDEWKYFAIRDLFRVELTKGDIKADEVDKGKIPLISSGESNNGVVKYITEEGDGIAEMFPENTITLDMFCHANYQGLAYYAVGHGRVNILFPKFELNRYIGIFICTLINREEYRFSYGRAVYSTVAEKMKIKLPAVKKNDGTYTPDWQFMEDYIKSLPFSKNIEPSDPKEIVDELVEMKKEMIKMRQQLEAQRSAQELKIIGGNVTYIDNSQTFNLKK